MTDFDITLYKCVMQHYLEQVCNPQLKSKVKVSDAIIGKTLFGSSTLCELIFI